MKKILFIGVILLGVFLIYLFNIDKKVYYLSLGDELSVGFNESNNMGFGYSDYVKDYLEKKDILETYINSFFEENMRTTDLIRMINDNEKVLIDNKNKTIKNALIKADVLTLSIGYNDIISKLSLYENYNEKEMYEYLDEYLLDLENLFKILRDYCKETIIFIGYYNILDDENINNYIKYLNKKTLKLCEKYNIKYIDIFDIMKQNGNKSVNLYPTKKGYTAIGDEIIKMINK